MIEHIISDDGLVHDAARLKELQALPWQRKVQITQARIIEFVERMGGVDNVCVSVSGKDSTVLLHIARQIYPTIQAVYVDTGLEFPEVRQLARKNGAEIIRPAMSFHEVITQYGYPIVSKEVAEAIYYARRIREREQNEPQSENVPNCRKRKLIHGTNRRLALMGTLPGRVEYSHE